ncbi:MAG: CorA family divalent cation transporter [Roseburia sp.]
MQDTDVSAFFAVMSTAEFREKIEQFAYQKEMLHSLGSIRYCKAELYKDCIIGTIRLPEKNEQKKAQLSFGFYLTGRKVFFIEDEGKLKAWIEKQTEMIQEADTPKQLLLRIMEHMIEEDTLYFSHMESELDKLEEEISVGAGRNNNFFTSLTKHRQKLSEFNIYYEQLIDIGELFSTCDFYQSEQDTEGWDRFIHRVERLQNHVHLLRENVLQIRELYQSMQDARQNKIMAVITIVTTIFLPLTLITGWYGMNFVYMPELQWRYGYFAVIMISLFIVIAEIVYFKKKKVF